MFVIFNVEFALYTRYLVVDCCVASTSKWIVKFNGKCLAPDGTATSYQVKQLEQQNERMKEGLVK